MGSLPLSRGRILAVDYGLKKVGLAITDPDQSIVFPREVLPRESDEHLVDLLARYVQENRVSFLVIGMPFHEDQTESFMTKRVKNFIAILEKIVLIPIFSQNENFTSGEAEMILQELGMAPAERRKHRDSLSAMIILRSYLLL